MKKTCRKSKVEYIDGYNHYGKKRNTFVIFRLNEAEKAFLDDLISVMHIKNISAFMRGQAFKAYHELSAEQKAQMGDVAVWRLTEDVASLS